MISCTNLIVRERFGSGGPTIALQRPRRRRAARVTAGSATPTAPRSATAACTAAASRCRSRTSPPTRSRCSRSRRVRARSSTARSSCTSPTTRRPAARSARRGCSSRACRKPDFAICAGFSYGVTTAHNGCLHLEVEITGKSGHAAEPEKGDRRARGGGADPATTSTPTARRSPRSSRRSRASAHPTLVVGLIKGGINTNVVPDKVMFRLDRRIIPEEVPGAAERFVTALIKESAREDAGHQGRRAPHPARQARSCRARGRSSWSHAIQRNARDVFGVDVKPHGVPLYTDARHYSEAGIPDRALRRRSAHARGGERPSRRREPEARRPLQGDRGGGADVPRSARREEVTNRPVEVPLGRVSWRATSSTG